MAARPGEHDAAALAAAAGLEVAAARDGLRQLTDRGWLTARNETRDEQAARDPGRRPGRRRVLYSLAPAALAALAAAGPARVPSAKRARPVPQPVLEM
jgi:hypothetical protein